MDASGVPVPARWRTLRVSKQGDDDSACGLHCLTTAARHLGTIKAAEGACRILRKLNPQDRERIWSRLCARGLFEKDLRILAAAAGLAVYRPKKQDVAQFKDAQFKEEPDQLWMALVKVPFTDPNGDASTSEDDASEDWHYVLVLEHLADEGVLVLADPHPWKPSVYCMRFDDFESAWRAAKDPPWAALLYPAS